MRSNIALSSKAGFVVAISMNGFASSGMSAHLRNSFTRPRIEFRYRSTTSVVSTSTAWTPFAPCTWTTFPPERL